MDLKKLTKDELIKMVEDRKHLSSVVSEKEKEIERLKEKHREDLKTQEKRTEQRIENAREEQKEYVQNLRTYVEKHRKNVNELVFQYGALLKTLQGSVDAHIYINDKIIEDLKEE